MQAALYFLFFFIGSGAQSS